MWSEQYNDASAGGRALSRAQDFNMMSGLLKTKTCESSLLHNPGSQLQRALD